jgi:hypothetical protein
MKLSRSLNIGLALVIILIAVIAWVSYQLNWIRQRHEYLTKWNHLGIEAEYWSPPGPWQLQLFGEQTRDSILAVKSHEAEARALFPEARISVYRDSDAPQPPQP